MTLADGPDGHWRQAAERISFDHLQVAALAANRHFIVSATVRRPLTHIKRPSPGGADAMRDE
jgi:hypothetical protein